MSFQALVIRRSCRAGALAVLGLTLAVGACGSSGKDDATSTTSTTVSVPGSSTTTSGGTAAPTTEPVPDTAPTTSVSDTTVPTTPPDTPTGLFLNTHTLSLSGGAVPGDGQSVCKTTPGATCNIRFTKDGQTKELGAKVADSSGNVEWSWTPAEVGLTAGQWQVEIIAARGDYTAVAEDPLGLQVDP
jgi:hypothetical protein